jgi:uncharacterized protein
LVRRLPPWGSNLGKRLVRSPKIYVRDSGVLDALLELETWNDIVGHPVVSASWEGFVIENLASSAGRWTPYFYRTEDADACPAVSTLVLKSKRKHALEITPCLFAKAIRSVRDVECGAWACLLRC